MEMKRLEDVATAKNKYFKVYKGFMMNHGEQMEFAVDGESVYALYELAVVAALSEALNKNEMDIAAKDSDDSIVIKFKPISEIEPDDEFRVQVLTVKVLTSEMDFENTVLNDDESFYFRACDYNNREVELDEYIVTDVHAFKDENGVHVDSARIRNIKDIE